MLAMSLTIQLLAAQDRGGTNGEPRGLSHARCVLVTSPLPPGLIASGWTRPPGGAEDHSVADDGRRDNFVGVAAAPPQLFAAIGVIGLHRYVDNGLVASADPNRDRCAPPVAGGRAGVRQMSRPWCASKAAMKDPRY